MAPVFLQATPDRALRLSPCLLRSYAHGIDRHGWLSARALAGWSHDHLDRTPRDNRPKRDLFGLKLSYLRVNSLAFFFDLRQFRLNLFEAVLSFLLIGRNRFDDLAVWVAFSPQQTDKFASKLRIA